ncbi:MAG: polysaccharide biosynthesis protein [Clostridiales Family XIII bacterium]|jgi:UDP-N-acetylglucosamine:LPS N-acetylglucosamine transferase|nr:polysaccharide biosynthesis protein [Clostridiales Family XIII bacterium]
MKKVMFIASTGGHLDELMQLKPLFARYDYHIVTERDPSTESLKDVYGDRFSFLCPGTRKNMLTYPFKLFANSVKSFGLFVKYRPAFVVTTGTHTAVPMCYIAKLFRAGVIFIETFANRDSKTLAGRMVYPIADMFIVQWEEMLALYPKAVCGGSIY